MAQFVISLYRSFIGFVNLGYDGEIIFFRKFDLSREGIAGSGQVLESPFRRVVIPSFFMRCKGGFFRDPYDIMSRTC